MQLRQRRKKPLNRDDTVKMQRVLASEMGRVNARLFLQAINKAFLDTRADAMNDLPEDQEHTFYAGLRRKIHRQLRLIASREINVRVAYNGGGHENFLLFQVGNLIGTISKAESFSPGYSETLYRKMLHETERLMYADGKPPLKCDENTVMVILRWKYDLSEGIPYGPSDVTVSAFKEDRVTLGASISLIDLAAGKKLPARVVTVKPAVVPAAQNGLFPGLLVDPSLGITPKRRRDGQAIAPDDEETKTS